MILLEKKPTYVFNKRIRSVFYLLYRSGVPGTVHSEMRNLLELQFMKDGVHTWKMALVVTTHLWFFSITFVSEF